MSASKKATVLNVKRTPIIIDSKGTMLGGGCSHEVDLGDPATTAALKARFIVVLSVPEEKAPAKVEKSTPGPKRTKVPEVQSEKPKAPAQIVSEEG